jgi:hypothetical protein
MFSVARKMEIPFVGCFAHLLNLIVRNALDEFELDVSDSNILFFKLDANFANNVLIFSDSLKAVIEKCRSIVGTFNHSNKCIYGPVWTCPK